MARIIDSRYLLVNNNYFIFTKQKKFTQVNGKKLIIKGFEDFEFFVYKNNEDIIICEAFTGTKVNTVEGNFSRVLKATMEELNDLGKIELKKIFSSMIEITRLSPRYRYICTPVVKN